MITDLRKALRGFVTAILLQIRSRKALLAFTGLGLIWTHAISVHTQVTYSILVLMSWAALIAFEDAAEKVKGGRPGK